MLVFFPRFSSAVVCLGCSTLGWRPSLRATVISIFSELNGVECWRWCQVQYMYCVVVVHHSSHNQLASVVQCVWCCFDFAQRAVKLSCFRTAVCADQCVSIASAHPFGMRDDSNGVMGAWESAVQHKTQVRNTASHLVCVWWSCCLPGQTQWSI